MAICFKCWKLVKITEVKSRKVYYDEWRRWGYEIKSEDLMKDHWDNSCFKAKTATIAKNTMPSAPNFEPACISPARQEMVLPISHYVLNQKSEALNRPTPPPLPQKPVTLIGGLERYPMQCSASAPEIRNLWNDQSNMPNISSRTILSDLAEAYFDSIWKNAGKKID
jgi:hypothetical protein